MYRYALISLIALCSTAVLANVADGSPARSSSKTGYGDKPSTGTVKSAQIWSSTFANASDWTLGHDAAACSLDWVIGTTVCGGSFPIPTIESTSASDGWAMIDSDLYGETNGGGEVEDSWMDMSNPVDLTAFPNVVVEFETLYRRFNSERPYLVVGFGDGTGLSSVVWPDLDPQTDISAMPNVFEVFPGMADGEESENPMLVRINISQALAGASALELQNVYVRLHWTGTWGYAWFVDDFRIAEQADDDIELAETWFTGVNNAGIQYGRIPSDQLDNLWTAGASVYNAGALDQTNLVFDADYTVFSVSGTDPSLLSESSIVFEGSVSNALSVGTYTGMYSVKSDADTLNGLEYGDNTRQRTFEVTGGSQVVYSMDAIGLHLPADEKLGAFGTTSFISNESSLADGVILANRYPIRTQTQLSGFRVLLASGSMVGGTVLASIKDTATFWDGDMTSIYTGVPAYISATDLSNGYIDVFFDGPVTLDTGVYYAAVQLYSNGNAADVIVVDDRTLSQPDSASMVFVPGGILHTTGTAFGIRMLMGSDWEAGLAENTLNGVRIYPNPSEGLVTVSNDQQQENTIVVSDMAGRVVLTTTSLTETTLDLSSVGTGVYVVTVSNTSGSLVERIVIR